MEENFESCMKQQKIERLGISWLRVYALLGNKKQREKRIDEGLSKIYSPASFIFFSPYISLAIFHFSENIKMEQSQRVFILKKKNKILKCFHIQQI